MAPGVKRTNVPYAISRSCALYGGSQVVRVITRPVAAMSGNSGTGPITPTSVGCTHWKFLNRYVYQPSRVCTKIGSPIRSSPTRLNASPYPVSWAAIAKLPTPPGIAVPS